MRVRALPLLSLTLFAILSLPVNAQDGPPPPPIDGGGTVNQQPPSAGGGYPAGGPYPVQGPAQGQPGRGYNGPVQRSGSGVAPGGGGYPPGQYPQGQYPNNGNANQNQQEDAPPAPEPPKHVLQVHDGDTMIYCLPFDVVRLSGHYSDTRPLDHSFLEIDRARDTLDSKVISETVIDSSEGSVYVKPAAGGNSDDYSFDWTAPETPGTHAFRVGYILSSGPKHYAQRVGVTVLKGLPFKFDPEELRSIADLPVTVTLDPASPFAATKIDVYFDADHIGAFTGPPFKLTIPLAKAAAGKHALRIVATDDNGGRFEYLGTDAVEASRPLTLMVPPRVALAKPGETIPVTAAMAKGFNATKIDFYVKPPVGDDKLVTTSTAAPYSVDLDLSTIMTGPCKIYAIATTPAGTTRSEDYPLYLKNPAGEALAAKAAQEAAVKKAQADEDAAAAAADAAMKSHKRLTWADIKEKVSGSVAQSLAAMSAGGGKTWKLVGFDHIVQPDTSKNVYVADAIVDSPSASLLHATYSVDIDTGKATDLHRSW